MVTIGGSTPAQVYTNNANYTGFGGNGTTTGTFAGAGANNPLPLTSPAVRSVLARATYYHAWRWHIPSGRRTTGTINVSSTAELLALLDGASSVLTGGSRSPIRRARLVGGTNHTNINRLSRLEHRLAIQRIRDRGVTRLGGGKLAAAQ